MGLLGREEDDSQGNSASYMVYNIYLYIFLFLIVINHTETSRKILKMQKMFELLSVFQKWSLPVV